MYNPCNFPSAVYCFQRKEEEEEEKKSADDWNVSAQGLLWFVYTSHTFGSLGLHVPSLYFGGRERERDATLSICINVLELVHKLSHAAASIISSAFRTTRSGFDASRIINTGTTGWMLKPRSSRRVWRRGGHHQLPSSHLPLLVLLSMRLSGPPCGRSDNCSTCGALSGKKKKGAANKNCWIKTQAALKITSCCL